MTESEGRALARTAAVLLVAATVRWGVSTRWGPPLMPADQATALPSLLRESQSAREEAARRAAPLAEGERLDPNRADEVDLDRLPGVGPATARAVVATREAGAAFRRPEDLLAVPGIGPATLERMRAHLDFSAPPPGVRGGGVSMGMGGGGSGAALQLNSATAADLERLPGIGPALAQRIVEERERLGGFRSVDDLLGVRGIGPSTLARLRTLVVVH